LSEAKNQVVQNEAQLEEQNQLF